MSRGIPELKKRVWMGKKKSAQKKKSGSAKNRVKTILPEDMMDGTDTAEAIKKQVFLPGMAVEEGHELDVDMSAYVMLRSLQTEWSCLSFDLLRDGEGEERTAFPMNAYMVAGSQAGPDASGNQLMLVRMANLWKNQATQEEDIEDQSDSEGEEEEEEGKKPHFSLASIPHHGCVNRVRSHQSQPGVLTATWSELGVVSVWSLAESLQLLQDGTTGSGSSSSKKFDIRLDPFHVNSLHGTEGYALDWAPASPWLLAGDCAGHISLTSITGNGAVTESTPFTGHEGSVEDIQWSPSEGSVFASCSTDGTVRLWDIRIARNSSAMTWKASDVDLNVISWNRQVNNLLASGDDSGKFGTWDLRALGNGAVYQSDWHKAPITSIEWNPTDASVLAVSGADDQVTIWDFAITEKNEETDEEEVDVPDQLLFIHQGQQEIKEIHWHPQLSGVMVSTAGTGFNIFKTISV